MAYQIKAKIIFNKIINSVYGSLAFNSGRIAEDAQPGQFLNIKVINDIEPLLRRPFGVHRIQNSTVEILYEILGLATKVLSTKKAGEYLNVLGPLGKGFCYPSSVECRASTIIVAGGMGVAPLLFLAEKLVQSKPLVLIGAKGKNQILCEKEFKKLGCDVKIATDDGSRGYKGKVTDLLKRFLSTVNCQLSTIYACGPRPMLAKISQISRKNRIPAQVSLEEHMACGIGACLGCAIETKEGYKRVCKEGPVFNADEVIWQKGGQ